MMAFNNDPNTLIVLEFITSPRSLVFATMVPT
jgi:hypothetical protein